MGTGRYLERGGRRLDSALEGLYNWYGKLSPSGKAITVGSALGAVHGAANPREHEGEGRIGGAVRGAIHGAGVGGIAELATRKFRKTAEAGFAQGFLAKFAEKEKKEKFEEKPFRPGVFGHLRAGLRGASQGAMAYKAVKGIGIGGAIGGPLGRRIGEAMTGSRGRSGENWLQMRDRHHNNMSVGEHRGRVIGNALAGAVAAYFAGKHGYNKSIHNQRTDHVIEEAVRRHKETVEKKAMVQIHYEELLAKLAEKKRLAGSWTTMPDISVVSIGRPSRRSRHRLLSRTPSWRLSAAR